MKQNILSILLIVLFGSTAFTADISTNIAVNTADGPTDVENIVAPEPLDNVAVAVTNQSDNASNIVQQVVAEPKPSLIITNNVVTNTVVANSVVTNTIIIKDDQKVDELTQSLAAAKMRLLESSVIGKSGRLMDLERKAIEYDTMSLRITEKNEKIAELRAMASKANDIILQREAEVAELKRAIQDLNDKLKKAEAKDSEEGIDMDAIFKVGKFEYYEVKSGDTFETIAGQSIVYNDVNKAPLLKQANRKILLNGGKLEPGSVMIIPRLPTADNNEL